MAGLLEERIHPKTSLYGKYFEQFIITEIYRLTKYYEKDWKLSYLMSRDGAEIDLILEKSKGKRVALEIKSTARVDEKEVRAFERLASDISGVQMIFLSQDINSQKYGDVECLYWKDTIKTIFEG